MVASVKSQERVVTKTTQICQGWMVDVFCGEAQAVGEAMSAELGAAVNEALENEAAAGSGQDLCVGPRSQRASGRGWARAR